MGILISICVITFIPGINEFFVKFSFNAYVKSYKLLFPEEIKRQYNLKDQIINFNVNWKYEDIPKAGPFELIVNINNLHLLNLHGHQGIYESSSVFILDYDEDTFKEILFFEFIEDQKHTYIDFFLAEDSIRWEISKLPKDAKIIKILSDYFTNNIGKAYTQIILIILGISAIIIMIIINLVIISNNNKRKDI